MKIGVVCEGPTDFPAIESFIGHALALAGYNASFVSLFPEMDQTRPAGGWAQVMTWLQRTPPSMRIQRYFGGGLFGGQLEQDKLDAVLVHLDTDILENESFQHYILQKYGIAIVLSDAPVDRGGMIVSVLEAAMDFSSMTVEDKKRHVPFPAVESTEAWCVAAFYNRTQDAEVLKGQDLVNCFMAALEQSESKSPQSAYANIDKSLHRRRIFCAKHGVNSRRIMKDCEYFSVSMKRLIASSQQKRRRAVALRR